MPPRRRSPRAQRDRARRSHPRPDFSLRFLVLAGRDYRPGKRGRAVGHWIPGGYGWLGLGRWGTLGYWRCLPTFQHLALSPAIRPQSKWEETVTAQPKGDTRWKI